MLKPYLNPMFCVVFATNVSDRLELRLVQRRVVGSGHLDKRGN
jgi:hypothetical protein